MTERLFEDCNPNKDIMVVPQEEGGAEGDNYFGSIGDATMKHVLSMSDFERQMWWEILLMRSGDMFRMVPSWDDNDHDPFNLRGKDLDEYLSRFEGKVSDSELAALKEAAQVEQDRRDVTEESEDALDQERIPYEDWEKFPGHWSKMDIPSTPRDRAVYVGNTRQQFYDVFPEGHPNAGVINQFLAMFNRKWEDGLDEGYAKWAEKQLEATPMRHYVRYWLTRLVWAIAQNNEKATEYTERALKHIDRAYAKEYLNETAQKALAQPMTQLFIKKEQEWKQKAKEGFNIHSAVKQFGQMLFTDFRNQMTSFHWAKYRRIRDKHAPRVMLKGVDINRCGLGVLQAVLRMSREQAAELWFARPFSTLEEARSKGFVDGLCFADDDATDRIIVFLEKHAEIACKNKDMSRMNDVRKVLFNMQKDKKGSLDGDQWGTVWRYYRILKQEVAEAINDQR